MQGRGLPSLRLAARRATDEVQRTHPVIKPGQPADSQDIVCPSLFAGKGTFHAQMMCCSEYHVMAEHAVQQHLTIQHSKALHSTAWHGTAQRLMAQHDT